MALEDTDQLAQQRIARAFREVPAHIVGSVFTAYRQITATLPDAVQAAHHRLADACALESSIGGHQDRDGTAVAIYLSQHDIDRLNLGQPVDLRTSDQRGAPMSVHLLRERRPFLSAPTDSGPHTQAAS